MLNILISSLVDPDRNLRFRRSDRLASILVRMLLRSLSTKGAPNLGLAFMTILYDVVSLFNDLSGLEKEGFK